MTSPKNTIEKVTDALKEQGFGVITEINVKDTLKNKIDVDFRKYTILGACHPESAYHALQNEKKIGVFLPCNVVVEENETGQVEVTVVDHSTFRLIEFFFAHLQPLYSSVVEHDNKLFRTSRADHVSDKLIILSFKRLHIQCFRQLGFGQKTIFANINHMT